MSIKKEIKILEEHLINGLKWESLQRGDHIDGGSFSQVYVYLNQAKKDDFYACKIIRLKPDSDTEAKTKKEIEILEKIAKFPKFNDFAVVFFGYAKYMEITSSSRSYFALAFELAAGTLDSLLDKRKSGLSYEEIRDLMTIGEGMYNLQKLEIAHRDIKPSNILYFKVENNKIKFKLIDFGEVKFNVDAGRCRRNIERNTEIPVS